MSEKPAVLVVSSFVVRGGVGLRAAFALERLGHAVWALPTVILAHHPGHGRTHRLVPAADDFAALAADIAGAPWLGEIGAVISGYLGDAGQAEVVAGLVAAVKERNPAAFYLCDPVCGDVGGLYVPEATAGALRDRLLPLADIATPNLAELGFLAGHAVLTPGDLVASARALGPATVVVTSAPALMRNSLATTLVTADLAMQAEHPLVAHAPKGPGDLFAALYTARRLEGLSPEETLSLATAGAFEMVARAARAGSDEILLAFDQDALVRPMASVTLRRLGVAATAPSGP